MEIEGTSWRLLAVYDSSRGSGRARKSFRRGTFDLRQVPTKVEGGIVMESGECHVDVQLEDKDAFRLSLGPCDFAGWADLLFHVNAIAIDTLGSAE